ncbi:MAG TPA: riboflavin synthase [Vicinamibacterales bacterium]|nr:riboflavin synthase [Vicinamibacterales bacterium]
MFTGLIEAVGTVESLTAAPAGSRLRVAAPLAGELSPGESLAINGVCLTVVATGDGSLQADVSPETLRVSSLGFLGPGALVNLERPLRADARLGGHFVQGHVDATGTIERLRPDGDSYWLTIAFPPGLAPYIVRKGSIAVDGISLTVAGLAGGRFDVQIIPFTFQRTNLRAARVKTVVNLECDILGKYVVRALEFHREVEPRTP